MKTCLLLTILAMNGAVDAFEDTYWFPPTTKTLTHGLCAIGFESVSATSSSDQLTYANIPELDGERLWLGSVYVGEAGFCEGGTYLQPDTTGAFPIGTEIYIKGSVDPSAEVAQICYFVESTGSRNDGGWGQLPGFEYVKEYDWDGGSNSLPYDVSASIYCRNIKSLNSMDIWEGRQNFPTTKTSEFVHGLCAIGFESVSATSDNSILTYEPVEEWNDEEPLWLGRDYVGDGSFCKGGTYLKPSKVDQTPPGTNIAIEGLVDPNAVVARICYFVESTGNRRDGGWVPLPGFEYVKEFDWDASNNLPYGVQAKIYCKTFNTRVTLKLHL